MRFFLLFIMIAVALSGCAANQQESAAKSLLLSKKTLVTAAQSADEMCTANILTQDQCDNIGQLYDQAKVAYDLAVNSMIIGLANRDDKTAWEKYTVFHNQFSVLYVKFFEAALKLGLVEVEQ